MSKRRTHTEANDRALAMRSRAREHVKLELARSLGVEQLELALTTPQPASRSVACPECGRRNYHLAACRFALPDPGGDMP